jgi:hypothetical protein
MDIAIQQELRDRMRRIETRMTRFMEAHGFDTKIQRPQWDHGFIHVPTASVSLKDCLDVIPAEWPRGTAVTVIVKQDELCTLYR